MDNRLVDAAQSFVGTFYDVLARLGQNLDGDILRNELVVNQIPGEFKFRIGGSWKANFDGLETKVNQVLEKAQLLVEVHGDFQSLVAITQVKTAPDGCFGQGLVWPLAVWQVDRCKRQVFVGVFHVD